MNPLVTALAPSLIRSINARRRPGDIDLGIGQPTFPPDLEAFEAALEWTRANGSPYSPNAGFPELREGIDAYLAAGGWTLERSERDVCVTVGSEEALYLAIKTAVDPAADEVLIVEPCYLAYSKICAMEGIRHRVVALDPRDGFRPDAEVVIRALSPATRLVILNSPANPTGRIWPADEVRRLAAHLRDAHPDTFVLSDEVYRELHYDFEPVSVASQHGNTLIAGSLSKSSAATGLRLGWLAGPREVIAEAIKVHQLVNTAATTFSQRVGIELIRDRARLSSHRARYAVARGRVVNLAMELGLDMIPPEGAFYGFVRLPERYRERSLEVAERILDETRVITVPGCAFGASSEGWLRVSWVAPEEALAEGLSRIAIWLNDER